MNFVSNYQVDFTVGVLPCATVVVRTPTTRKSAPCQSTPPFGPEVSVARAPARKLETPGDFHA